MNNGNINEYIKKHDDVNRAQLVSYYTRSRGDQLTEFRSWWMSRMGCSISTGSNLSMGT